MSEINGYPADAIAAQVFAKWPEQTASAIHARLAAFEQQLSANGDRSILMSVGENCAAGTRLRTAGLAHLGSQFFDNIVVPIDRLPALLDADFAELLCLSNLKVDRWERHDSVLDVRHGIHFHHYFHLRGMEKLRTDKWNRQCRRIDEADIPLFLSAVRAQFEYLAAKFRTILRAPVPTWLVVRRVRGEPVPPDMLKRIVAAADRFGAVNTQVIAVHAQPLDAQTKGHFFIPDEGERWGRSADWAQLPHLIASRS